ncbi:hypothetical protein [Micromonospora ureilytica]|uniref:hypothetical protein n=1 Tax=Micromonospora ureilytica TaxID=709868 RepID=UPI00403A5D95
MYWWSEPSDPVSQQPWWTPVLVGVFTLLAAILTQISAALLERKKQRREDMRRWDVERRRVYAEFLQAMDQSMTELHRNWAKSPPPWNDIFEAAHKAKILRYEVDLIASKSVRNEAAAFWQTIGDGLKARRSNDDSKERQKAFLNSFNTQAKKMVQAIRTELGLADDWKL